MYSFTYSLSAGLAAAALLLASPTAHAQSPGFMTADLRGSSSDVASISPPPTSAASTSEAVQNLNSPKEDPNFAYYNDSHKDLTQALAWMQETNAMHPEYWSVYAEARIRLQLKDYAGAQTKATEAKKLAVTAANADYARRSEELLTQLKSRAK